MPGRSPLPPLLPEIRTPLEQPLHESFHVSLRYRKRCHGFPVPATGLLPPSPQGLIGNVVRKLRGGGKLTRHDGKRSPVPKVRLRHLLRSFRRRALNDGKCSLYSKGGRPSSRGRGMGHSSSPAALLRPAEFNSARKLSCAGTFVSMAR